MQEENTIIEATPFQRASDDTTKKLINIKPLPTAIGLVFLILALAAAFLFSARAVSVLIDPVPDTFRFTSGFSYQVGERYLMLSGDYSFTAAKTGYYILSESIDVTGDADQDFSFDMTRLPGVLHITTEPDTPAEVFVDQQLIGTSPLTLKEITPGVHDISIRSKRYLDYDTEIDIEGMRIEQNLAIPLSPAWANVTLNSSPFDAEILVDNVSISETPDAVEVLQGERSIQIKKKGYKTWQTTITVVASIDQVINKVVLEKSDGRVSFASTPTGANVSINGAYRGQTPLQLVLAPAENYKIQLSKAGYQPFVRTLTVNPEEDLSLNHRLSPVLGSVRLMVEPAGGQLFIDDIAAGEASQLLSLTANQHEIRIEKPGYAPYITTVTPQPGSSQQLFIRLQTTDEARVAAIATTITTAIGQTMKLIISDEFTMGAGRREPGRRANEIRKTVKITRPYYLSTTEVTNKQYKEFEPAHESGILGRALLSEAGRPVVNVSWADAVQFCNWLSNKDGLPHAYKLIAGKWQAVAPINTGYRMPTEAEWVWAARYAAGPDPSRFPWGDNMPPVEVKANYADLSAMSMVPYHINGYNDSYRGPSPVELYPPNELGIHDLAGNVAEWIHDYYSVEKPKTTQIDPSGPDRGDYHVIRGSSYMHGRFSELRWTYRDYGDLPRTDVGFRIARYFEDKESLP